MCYTKLYKGPAEGKTAGFVLEMFHVEHWLSFFLVRWVGLRADGVD